MAEDIKALARRWCDEAWNKGRLDAVDEFFLTTTTVQDPVAGTITGIDGFKEFAGPIIEGLTERDFKLVDLLAEGDKFMFRFVLRAKHTGEFLGVPPTGKQITITGLVMVRVANGKFTEGWQEWDVLGVLKQLGVTKIPA